MVKYRQQALSRSALKLLHKFTAVIYSKYTDKPFKPLTLSDSIASKWQTIHKRVKIQALSNSVTNKNSSSFCFHEPFGNTQTDVMSFLKTANIYSSALETVYPISGVSIKS